MTTGRCIIFAALAFWNITETAFSQTAADQPGAFLRLGAGVRALALGGAFSAVGNDAAAGYWNPAGLATINQTEIIASYRKMSLNRRYNFVSAALPAGLSGSFGISWIGLGVNDLEARTGNTAQPDFLFNDQENALLLTYGRKLNSIVSAGVNLKGVHQKLAGVSAFGAGLDAAVILQPFDYARFGLNVQNIAMKTRWSNERSEKFPLTLRGGAAVNLTQNFLVAADVFKVGEADWSYAIGAEYLISGIIPARFGAAQGEIQGGVGLIIPMQTFNLNLDYALGTDVLTGEYSHKLSLGFSLHGGRKQSIEEAASSHLYGEAKSKK